MIEPLSLGVIPHRESVLYFVLRNAIGRGITFNFTELRFLQIHSETLVIGMRFEGPTVLMEVLFDIGNSFDLKSVIQDNLTILYLERSIQVPVIHCAETSFTARFLLSMEEIYGLVGTYSVKAVSEAVLGLQWRGDFPIRRRHKIDEQNVVHYLE